MVRPLGPCAPLLPPAAALLHPMLCLAPARRACSLDCVYFIGFSFFSLCCFMLCTEWKTAQPFVPRSCVATLSRFISVSSALYSSGSLIFIILSCSKPSPSFEPCDPHCRLRVRVLIRIAKGCKRMQLDAKVVSKTVRGMH